MGRQAASKKRPATTAAAEAAAATKIVRTEQEPPAPSTAAAGGGAGEEAVAGLIFMCSAQTKEECYRRGVFGMPRARMDVVRRVKRGAALFLYDFDVKHLYGIYRAACDGGQDLVPAAFGRRFPAQVKFEIEGDFQPIPERSVKSAIEENYNSKGKFTPELSAMQVSKLRKLFRPITSVPQSAPGHYFDDRYHAPPATYLHPPVHLPAPVAHMVPPAAYVHPSTACQPQAVHWVRHAACVPTPADPYRSGNYVHAASPAGVQYGQSPLPSRDCYAQYPDPPPPTESQHVSAPVVYSNDPYYSAHLNDPYRLDALRSQYQESTIASTTNGAPLEAAATNLILAKNHPGQIVSYIAPVTRANAIELPPHRRYPVPHAASATWVRDAPVSTSYFYARTAGAPHVNNPLAPPVHYVGSPAPTYR